MELDFKDGRYMLRDCFDRIHEIPDASVDMILCDLPYGTTQNKWDTVLPLDALWREYWRVAKPNAAVVLSCTQPFTSVLGASQIARLKYAWVWHKNIVTGHLNAKKRPMRNHEDILVFSDGSPPYFPQGLERYGRVKRRGHNGSNFGKSGSENWQETTGYPRSVIKFDADKSWRPTQKPVALFEYLIRTYTNPGETDVKGWVQESTTTARACIASGRRFVCIERDESYFFRATADLLGV